MRALLTLVVFLGACASRPGSAPPRVQGYAVEAATIDPVVIERAPRVLYGGEWARLVDGHWFYPTTRGWVVFREEPAELRRERETAGIEQPPTAAQVPRGPESPQLAGAPSEP